MACLSVADAAASAGWPSAASFQRLAEGTASSPACCRSVDTLAQAAHPRDVRTVSGRLVALLLSLAVVSAHLEECAGWVASAEARMACCLDGSCPMHQAEHAGAAPRTSMTQAQADACCASSSGHESNPSASFAAATISVAVLGDGTVLPAQVPARTLNDSWRVTAPVPLGLPPRYVLLASFLI
jgi:hypothetical protein